MLQRTFRIAFWAAAFFALVMATLPQPPELLAQSSDKVQHMLAFAALTALAMGAYPRVSILGIIIGLSAFGIAIEALQTIPSLHRDADLRDWLADTAAVLTVILIFSALRRRNDADAA